MSIDGSSRQNQTFVPIDPVLSQGVAKMDIAKKPCIVPMEIAPTGPDLNAVLKMMFCNQEHALNRKVVGPKASLAGIGVSAIADSIDLAANASEPEGFITAVTVAGPVLEQGSHPEVRPVDSIDRAADPSRIDRGKRDDDVIIPDVTAVP